MNAPFVVFSKTKSLIRVNRAKAMRSAGDVNA